VLPIRLLLPRRKGLEQAEEKHRDEVGLAKEVKQF
jgi:hypothetical protein